MNAVALIDTLSARADERIALKQARGERGEPRGVGHGV
jgi:hypothetical protein